MSQQTESEAKLARVLVEALDLEEVEPAAIAPEAPLFSLEDSGLGLDSIDALEISLVVSEQYGVEIKLEDGDLDEEALRQIFRSLRSLNRHIEQETRAA